MIAFFVFTVAVIFATMASISFFFLIDDHRYQVDIAA